MSPSPQLATRAARGAVALTVVALASRALSFVGQLALGWFLEPAHFGLYGAALAITSFATVLAQAGLRETLLQRSRRLALWARLATRMALRISFAGWAVCSVVALVWPWSPDREALRQVLPLLGAVWPLTAGALAAEARLNARLEFKRTSRIAIGSQVVTLALQVILAWAGLGIYALVVPYVAGAAVRTFALRRAAGPLPRARRAPSMRRGLLLLGRSRWAMAVTLLGMVWAWGDYLLLGLRFDTAQVGQYYFAFALATAAMLLLTQNVSAVLFPALLHLKGDGAAQWRAGYKALSLLALLGVPMCAGQVLVGQPLLRLVYGDKWAAAEWMFALLSIGMGSRVVGSSAGAVMQAQGRFRYQAKVQASLAVLFVAFVAAGLATGSLRWTVAAIAAFYLWVGPYNIWAAGRAHGATVRDAVALYVRPSAWTAAAYAAALGAERAAGLAPDAWLAIAALRFCTFSVGFAALALLFERGQLEAFWSRLRPARAAAVQP